MAQEELETPIDKVELHQRITPYKEIQYEKPSVDNPFIEYLKEYPFIFAIDDQVIEGGLQINLGISSFAGHSDQAPPLRPFPIDQYEGYSVGQDDTHFELREDKLAQERELEIEAQSPTIEGRMLDFFLGRYLKLSLCLFDNNLRGFSKTEQKLLKQIELLVLFDESANIRAAVGSIFFPSDLTSISSDPQDILLRQNSLGHPKGKGTKGRIPFGRITSFRPIEIQSVAHNDPLTDTERGRVGMGHPIELPGNLELIRFTQLEFRSIPSK